MYSGWVETNAFVKIKAKKKKDELQVSRGRQDNHNLEESEYRKNSKRDWTSWKGNLSTYLLICGQIFLMPKK